MTMWCPDCRSRQQVEDTSLESEYRHGREQHWKVHWLTCGHHREWDQGTTNTAPGAPYAPAAVSDTGALAGIRAMPDPFLDQLT